MKWFALIKSIITTVLVLTTLVGWAIFFTGQEAETLTLGTYIGAGGLIGTLIWLNLLDFFRPKRWFE